MRSLFLLFLFSFVLVTQLRAQDASNIKVEATSEELLISYDLDGREATLYDIKLYIIDGDGNRIEPKSLNGDIGSVPSGENKRIVWNVYEDVEELSGNIVPEIIVSTIEEKPTVVLPTPEPPKLVEDVYVEEVPGAGSKSNRFKVGTKFSLGNSSVLPGSNFDEKMFSWQGGIFFRWNALRKIYLQPELLYHRQAHRQVSSEINSWELIHHSARAQGIVGFSPFNGGLYIHGGPYYEYRFGSKRNNIENGEIVEIINDFPEMNGEHSPYKDFELGYVLGGNLNFGKGAFALGVQYSKSLEDSINVNYHQPTGFPSGWDNRYKSILFYFQKAF